MHPYLHAQKHPEKPACIFAATGEVVTYRQLDERSNQGAHVLRSLGLKRGDVFAVCMENQPRYLEIAWSNQRAGLYMVCISTKLTAPEVEYILKDCGAKLFITSAAMQELAERVAPLAPDIVRFMVGGASAGYQSWDAALADMPADACAGSKHRLGHVVFLRHHRSSEGSEVSVERRTHRCAHDARAACVEVVWGRCGHGVSLAGAAVSRCAVALVPGRAASRRTGRDDGALRRRRGAAADRALSSDACPMGADAFRPLSATALRGAQALRPVVAPMCDPCSGAVSRSRQGADDRLVGTRHQ